MGLRAQINIQKWGFPDTTPMLHLPIDYTGVGELYVETTVDLAQSQCPVDTGFLQSSIHGNGGGETGSVEATAEYAQYVEYGTWKMGAQPYFTSAVEQGAQLAFMLAMQIYQTKMAEEAAILGGISAAGEGSMLGNQSGLLGGFTQTVNGVSFHQDGSLGKGMNYFLTQPSMWGTNTTMYKIATDRQAHLGEYRAAAMGRFAHDKQIRSAMVHTGSHMSSANSGWRNWATDLGYSVGMYSMGSIWAGGGSFFGGLAGGLLLGGLATIVGLFLGDIFGSEGPTFSMPEIEII